MLGLLQATSPASAMNLLHRLWAYITLGVTGIVTEEATPLIGGLAAHDHRLRLSAVGIWVSGGTWVADIGLYYVGRWRGHWARRRWPRLRSFMLRTLRVVRRHPWRASLAVRWGYGLRMMLPIACGAGRVPVVIYFVGSAISCATWAFTFTLLGWAFGRTTLLVVGHVRRYENFLVAAIILGLAIGFWWIRRRQGYVEDEVVDAIASGDSPRPPKTMSTEGPR
ncbi:MAG TPA: VTT domain-containing protein [Gemmatimonadaceae bacterium]|jgi:membrane protein DedA with SNARE-associated domain|nr:VTT domain-containing protein [Gemmatimonadaceae bacterium]